MDGTTTPDAGTYDHLGFFAVVDSRGMDAGKEMWRAARDRTQTQTGYGPKPVLMALLSLMPPGQVKCWAAQNHESSSGETRWEVIWASDSALAVCSARKSTGGWDLDSHELEQEADSLVAYLMPLSQLSRIAVSIRERHTFGVVAEWEPTATVTMRTGETFSLPPIPDDRHYDRAGIEALIEHLCNRLS